MSDNRGDKKNNSLRRLLALVKPYGWLVAGVVALTAAGNGLSLIVPKLTAAAIDDYEKGQFDFQMLAVRFSLVAFFIFVFTYLQGIVQAYASELAARDLRTRIMAKIALQNYSFVEGVSPAKLLTNLTSDVDAVKSFVSLVIPSLASSVFLIAGASALMLMIDWKLALAVLALMPFIGLAFYLVLGRVHKLFVRGQEALDGLNRLINESILGAAIIRILDSPRYEYGKFARANEESKNIGLSILKYFAALMPAVAFIANLATLVILALGGNFVINGAMSLGNFAAFNSYLEILIFPIVIISFMSTVIAQADASYGRINEILGSPEPKKSGTLAPLLEGNIKMEKINLVHGQKSALKDLDIGISAGSRAAIIGPTAAGKTQLVYIISGLLDPTSGAVYYDGKNINEYDKAALHRQIGLVFQDSIIFNVSLRENIAFGADIKDADMEKAVQAAELGDFVESLPDGLDTMVSERGASLSGGQKQRIMLARALALNPKILILDDFTARVDAKTEQRIFDNINSRYPGITLVSVTQKIAPVKDYDQIILLMEGEVLARGAHRQLMEASPEYVQIYNSQKSLNQYEKI